MSVTEPPPDRPSRGVAHEDSAVVDSLNHPLAITIRDILNRGEKPPVTRILIDDAENIERALEAGLPIERVFHAGDETVPEALRRKLPPRATVHEVAKRTCK